MPDITAYPRRAPQRNQGAYEALIYSPSAKVGQLLRHLAKQTEIIARAEAPKRSGTLANSHDTTNIERGAVGRSRSGKTLSTQVINTAPHATYVHNGVTGPIEGRPMLYWNTTGPGVPGAWLGPWKAEHVRGQKANPWIVRAYNKARSRVPGLTNLREMSPNTVNSPAASRIVARRPWMKP